MTLSRQVKRLCDKHEIRGKDLKAVEKWQLETEAQTALLELIEEGEVQIVGVKDGVPLVQRIKWPVTTRKA